MTISYEWRGRFDNAEVEALHAEAFDHEEVVTDDWSARLHRYSLGWVCARLDGAMVGFVNVAWDGGIHAFVLDTMTAKRAQRRGVGARLIALAVKHAGEAGCDWLHVDFEPHLRPFYFDTCGFRPTDAGLIALR